MKTLKDIMNESGMNPAHSHSKHDSDHDISDVSDDNVVRRLNSFYLYIRYVFICYQSPDL